jgi:hypothetical protein
LAFSLHAQDAAWQKEFPTAEAAYTNLSCAVNFRLEEGKIVATSNYSEDLVLSTENAVKMMSRGYIHHSSFNALKSWNAYTESPQRKRLKVANAQTSSSRQSYIFYDDAQATSFDYVGTAVGATTHLEYELQHNDAHLLIPYYMERYFPVINGELQINFPSSLQVKYVVKGLHADRVEKTETRRKDKVTYTFKIKNLPGYRSYPDAPDNSYYSTHIIFYVEKIQQDGQWKPFLSNPDDLYRYNYEHIRPINKTLSPELQHLTDSITRGAATDLEKTKRIYQWVQSHIKYVAFEDGMEGFVPREASLVCSRRFGDCKDMASILTAMLNRANVPAYFTWIGTRDLPYSYHETPLPLVDNHMICAARVNGEYIFLDGTDEGCIFGMPSSGIQDKEAMIAISDKEYKIVKVPTPPKTRNQFNDSTILELGPNGLSGQVRVRMTGYYSSSMRTALNFRNEKEREDYLKERLARGSSKINFTDWKVQQSETSDEILVTATFVLPDYAKKLGDEWFLNLNLFKWYEHEEIDFPKRQSPIQNSFLNATTYTTVLKVPPSHQVSFLPKSQEYKNDVWGFKMNYTKGDGYIALTQAFDTDSLMYYPAQFEQWNKVLENLFPHYKQSVVLSKK